MCTSVLHEATFSGVLLQRVTGNYFVLESFIFLFYVKRACLQSIEIMRGLHCEHARTLLDIPQRPSVANRRLSQVLTVDPVCCRCTQGKVNFREKEKQVLDQILGPGRYDARIRPSGVNGTGEEITHTRTQTHTHCMQVYKQNHCKPLHLGLCFRDKYRPMN